ncbi:MAG: hypothetical protein H5T73_11495 [Actinobacteria bacterium]|nr:hypothetical protein [Actinomycetota bacterium]
MAACAPGLRPAAWWEFEAPEYGDPPKHCNPAAEIAFLRKHGLLSPEEEAQLKVMEELRKGSGT